MTSIQSIELSPNDHLVMQAHARAAFPRECCGILIGRRRGHRLLIEGVIRADNVTEGDPLSTYQIDWKTLLATRRKLRDATDSIVGFYHSHPDGTCRPSRRDAQFAWAEHVYLIVPVSPTAVGPPVAWWASVGGGDGPNAQEVGHRMTALPTAFLSPQRPINGSDPPQAP